MFDNKSFLDRIGNWVMSAKNKYERDGRFVEASDLLTMDEFLVLAKRVTLADSMSINFALEDGHGL